MRPDCRVLGLLDCLLFLLQDLTCPGTIRGSSKGVRSVWSKLFKRIQPVSSKEIRTIRLIQRCRSQSTAVECTHPGVPAINWEKIKVAFRVTAATLLTYSWVLFGPRTFWPNAIAKASTSGTSLSYETLGRFFVVLFSARADTRNTSPSPSTERIRTEQIDFFTFATQLFIGYDSNFGQLNTAPPALFVACVRLHWDDFRVALTATPEILGQIRLVRLG